jgi:hypothetical protein
MIQGGQNLIVKNVVYNLGVPNIDALKWKMLLTIRLKYFQLKINGLLKFTARLMPKTAIPH